MESIYSYPDGLESEIIYLYLFLFFHFWRDGLRLYCIGHDDHGFRCGRTDVFASAASDADILIQVRKKQTVFIRLHGDGLGRAMLVAGPAVGAVFYDDAMVFPEIGFPYLGKVFFLYGQRHQSPVGTNLGTNVTIVGAEFIIVFKGRKHKTVDSVF